MADLWTARQVAVKIADSSTITITTAAVLDSFFSSATAITAFMKNVTITPPEGDVEKEDFLGVDGNSFQNALKVQKPMGMAELTGTLVLDGDEMLVHNSKHLFFGSGTAVAGTHTRYQAGKTSSGTFTRPDTSIMVNLDDGTDEITFALDNATMTKDGDIKIDAADGHWEVDVTIKCLPKDYHEEYKD